MADRSGADLGRSRLDLVIIRLVFVVFIALACYLLQPFGLQAAPAGGLGLVIGAAVILFELRLRNASLKRLIGAVIGSIAGIFGAYLFSLVIRNSIAAGPTQSFLQLFVMMVMAYVGLVIGAGKGDLLNLAALGGLFGGEKQSRKSYKILDTSVIIDGRIADIAETGFLDGTIVIPQFVLRELQLVADSADSLKRNRGRRGLDILQRIQKIASLHVQIVEDDFPAVREVDLKLIELAKVYEGKIVTNDFNLNKVAQLQGVEVLNINELANSLKPIVLAGRAHAGVHPERRQGVQPGRRLPRRWNDGGGRQCAQDDRQDHRDLGHVGATDHRGQDDLREIR